MEYTLGVCPDWVTMDFEEWVGLVQLSEEAGYHYLWAPNEKFFRDMYVMAAVMAERTRTPHIGTFVADPFSLHPALTAMAIATLDEVSHGRAILGIGAGGTGFSAMGIKRTKPAIAIREAVYIIKRLLRGEVVDVKGEVIHFHQGQLNVPTRPDIPIIVASRGDLVLEMAGEVADGVMVSTFAEPHGIRHALSRVERGARRTRRDLSDLQIMLRLDVCIADDKKGATDAVKSGVAMLLWNSYPDRGFVDTVGLKVPDELEKVIATRDYNLAMANAHLVPDAFVEQFCLVGTADEVAERAHRAMDVGVDSITIFPHASPGSSVEHTVREFATAMRRRQMTGEAS